MLFPEKRLLVLSGLPIGSHQSFLGMLGLLVHSKRVKEKCLKFSIESGVFSLVVLIRCKVMAEEVQKGIKNKQITPLKENCQDLSIGLILILIGLKQDSTQWNLSFQESLSTKIFQDNIILKYQYCLL